MTVLSIQESFSGGKVVVVLVGGYSSQKTLMNRTVRSFFFAFRGFRYVLRGERNFQIELFVASLVILGMIVFDLSVLEEGVLILCIVWVLTLELVNTAVERIMDVLQPRVHPYARVIKDVMAAAVLVSAGGALLVGMFIFVPRIFHLPI